MEPVNLQIAVVLLGVVLAGLVLVLAFTIPALAELGRRPAAGPAGCEPAPAGAALPARGGDTGWLDPVGAETEAWEIPI